MTKAVITDCNSIVLRADYKYKSIVVVDLFRLSSSNIDGFIKSLSNILEQLLYNNEYYIITDRLG